MRSHTTTSIRSVTTLGEFLSAASFGLIIRMSSSRARLESLSGVLEGRLNELVQEVLASLSGVLSYCQRFEGLRRSPSFCGGMSPALQPSNTPVTWGCQMSSDDNSSGRALEVERRAGVRAKDVGASLPALPIELDEIGLNGKREFCLHGKQAESSGRIGRPNCWQHFEPYSKPEESELAISNASNSSAYQEMSP